MIHIDEIIEFTKRRFPINCNWLNGNCYFFALACKAAFSTGEIFYEVVQGHFIFKYQGKYYDWSGQIEPQGYLVPWDKFDDYDQLQKQRIIRDCIN